MYAGKALIPDLLANLPITVYTIIYNLPNSSEEVESYTQSWVFLTCMYLKTLRLLHINELTTSLTRTFEALADIFYMKRYQILKLLRWFLAAVKFL